MKSKLFAALAALVLSGAGNSAQAAVSLDLGNTTGQANANVLDGPDGNARIYTGSDGSNPFSVRITGWSISTGNIVTDAFLGAYSGWGLGVTNRSETGSNNTHTIDNTGGIDFVLLQFDRLVMLDQALFNSISGGDTDATVAFATTAAAWTASPAWSGQAASVLNATFASPFTTQGPSSDNWRDINPNDKAANIWMISAARPSPDYYPESFKLQGLKLSVSPVPEPSVWIEIVLGVALLGAFLRARRPLVPGHSSLAG